MERDGIGAVLDIEFEGSGFTFNSLTGYRDGSGEQVYDQTGAGPEALGWSMPARWLAYIGVRRHAYEHAAGNGDERPVPVRAAGRRRSPTPSSSARSSG